MVKNLLAGFLLMASNGLCAGHWLSRETKRVGSEVQALQWH